MLSDYLQAYRHTDGHSPIPSMHFKCRNKIELSVKVFLSNTTFSEMRKKNEICIMMVFSYIICQLVLFPLTEAVDDLGL